MSSPGVTSRPLPTDGPSAGGDEFDDLFDYDVDDENDPFSANYKVPSKKEPAKDTANPKTGAGLGIDEEVEVTRKPRAPRVKLDENRYGTWVMLRPYLIMTEGYYQLLVSQNYGRKPGTI